MLRALYAPERARTGSAPGRPAEVLARPVRERVPRPRRGQAGSLPAGVLRPRHARVDASANARRFAVERGRAGATRRVHVPPEPMPVLNGRLRRGRVAGLWRRTGAA